MSLNSLHAHFGAQSGTIEVSDPFGMDPPITFEMRRTSHPPYVRSLHATAETPAVARAIQAIAAEKLDAGEELEADSAAVQKKVLALLAAGEITLADLNEPPDASAARVAEHLVVGFVSPPTDLDTGKPVKFSKAAVLELLTYRELAGPQWPGKTVGEVLTEHLLEQAGAEAKLEAAANEAAEGNSARSSGGNSAGATETSSNDEN